jgi:hypothetical protein
MIYACALSLLPTSRTGAQFPTEFVVARLLSPDTQYTEAVCQIALAGYLIASTRKAGCLNRHSTPGVSPLQNQRA